MVSAWIWWTDLVVAVAWPPFLAFFRPRPRIVAYKIWTLNALWAAGVFAATELWIAAGCAGVSTLIAAWLWWRHRRRDRAPKTYGAKTKAIIAAMVRRAREAAQPRPVLRPVPGGAR
jgi:hypothetical protein